MKDEEKEMLVMDLARFYDYAVRNNSDGPDNAMISLLSRALNIPDEVTRECFPMAVKVARNGDPVMIYHRRRIALANQPRQTLPGPEGQAWVDACRQYAESYRARLDFVRSDYAPSSASRSGIPAYPSASVSSQRAAGLSAPRSVGHPSTRQSIFQPEASSSYRRYPEYAKIDVPLPAAARAKLRQEAPHNDPPGRYLGNSDFGTAVPSSRPGPAPGVHAAAKRKPVSSADDCYKGPLQLAGSGVAQAYENQRVSGTWLGGGLNQTDSGLRRGPG